MQIDRQREVGDLVARGLAEPGAADVAEAWPVAHVRFISPNARPCSSPTASAPSESIDIDGAHSRPITGEPMTISTPSVTASSGQGSRANVIAPPISPPSSGAIGPRRSLKRPASGRDDRLERRAHQPDRADRGRRRAELVQPQRPEHRQGPEQQPGHGDQQQPGAHLPVAQRARQPAQRAVAQRRGGGRPPASRPSGRRRSAAIEQNTSSKPARSAATPITGPSSAPAIAAPIAEPIICPRFSRGAAPASQAIAPAQDAAPPTPWTKRAMSSTRIEPANATATLESDHQRQPEQHGRASRRRAPPACRPAGRRRTSRPDTPRRGCPRRSWTGRTPPSGRAAAA